MSQGSWRRPVCRAYWRARRTGRYQTEQSTRYRSATGRATEGTSHCEKRATLRDVTGQQGRNGEDESGATNVLYPRRERRGVHDERVSGVPPRLERQMRVADSQSGEGDKVAQRIRLQRRTVHGAAVVSSRRELCRSARETTAVKHDRSGAVQLGQRFRWPTGTALGMDQPWLEAS